MFKEPDNSQLFFEANRKLFDEFGVENGGKEAEEATPVGDGEENEPI